MLSQSLSRGPITLIPPETLTHIFWTAVTSYNVYKPSEFYRRYACITQLRLVCRLWDHVATSTPYLWDRFAIDASTHTSRHPPLQVVDLWLQRAGTELPLSILVSMPSDDNSDRFCYMEDIFKKLSLHIRRWQELWFHSDAGVSGFPMNLYRARKLTRLSIDAGSLDEEATEEIGPAFRNFHGPLRDLNLEGATYDWIFSWNKEYGVRLNRLTGLKLEYEGWMQGVLNILSGAPNLTWAIIEADGNWSQPEYHVFDNTLGARLSKLRYLQLHIQDANLDLFRWLQTRLLETLDITVSWSQLPDHEKDPAPLLNFIERSEHILLDCRIEIPGLPSNWVTAFFRSPRLSIILRYRICNVAVDSNLMHDINSIMPPVIRPRLTMAPEQVPGYYSLGWAINGGR
ncbi:hypothetical protein P691DRAFT_790258 [Macrolepiota fuliginosa MF-IS2]|uniref:F-box domain-containing protein n=1 Tax=Macrolepiota fuliginosa MF-IS2 TaxID=1400762 RepID=A0A9P5X317_9AGAR|nr:hypothetical protein P691DRAFT_790258 [Macrolepiota fuliginosa MF-IS2]